MFLHSAYSLNWKMATRSITRLEDSPHTKSGNWITIGAMALCLAAASLLSGCATTGSQGDGTGPAKVKSVEGAYWVTAEFTPFYRFGPKQSTGPDLSLKKETRLTMTKRGYGFSEVILEDGTAGWVGTDDIKPVPDELLKADQGLIAVSDSRSGKSGKRPRSRAIVEFSDPDIEMPPPGNDLILPDSDAVPVIKPEFRY